MRLKKTSNLLAILALVLLVSISLGVAQLLSLGNMEQNIERRALNEVEECAVDASNNFNHSLALQFDILETLAKYLGDQESLETGNYEQLMRSVLTTNKYCTVAYTDKKGEILSAVSVEGDAPSGNVSDRQYFQKAVYWKDARAIQYMTKTAMTEDPRALFAVPIISKNVIVGCLFASTEQNFFESKIFSSTDYDEINVFLIDAEGTIVADPSNKGLFQNGYNIFESLLDETDAGKIQHDFSVSHNGSITIEEKNPSYLAYSETDFNGWRMVGYIDYQTAADKYANNIGTFNKMVRVISAIFVTCMAGVILVWLLLEKRKNKMVKELEDTSRNLVYFLEKSGNASFYFDAKKVSLRSSPALDEMVGNNVPDNWLSIIPERKKMHPEFDYDGVVRAYNDVITNQEYREVISRIKLADGRTRCLKISMAPTLDDNGNYNGIVGIALDITNVYAETKLGNEEQSHIMRSMISYIPLIASANLTQNTYSLISYAPAYCDGLSQEGNYNELMSYVTARVPESHASVFEKFFDKENLINAYQNGKNDIELEHPFIVNSESPEKWVIAKVSFLHNSVNDDVCLLFTIVDITQRKEYESLLQQNYANVVELESLQKKAASANEKEEAEVNKLSPSVVIRTFGYFDLFVNGQAVPFANEKSKEMLAVLVDRKGGFVSSSEMISYLWEDEPFDKRTQTRCRQVASRLKKTLDDMGIGDIVENVNGKRRIIPDKVDCDYFKYLSNKNEYCHLYNGSYMMNYSWGEMTIAELESDRSVK